MDPSNKESNVSDISHTQIRSALFQDSAFAQPLKCRMDFDPEYSVQQNKRFLKSDVEAILSSEGISPEQYRVGLMKVLKDRDDESKVKYILLSVKFTDKSAVDHLASGVFSGGDTPVAGKKTKGFTVRWPGLDKNNVDTAASAAQDTQSKREDEEMELPVPTSGLGVTTLALLTAVGFGVSAYIIYTHRHRLPMTF